jgi:hypothetical protein
MTHYHDEWTEIGKRCSAGRRSVWVRFLFRDGEHNVITPGVVEAIELKAGREGNDVELRITRENPQFAELLDLFLTAHFAATT